jgi:hypothetical protein
MNDFSPDDLQGEFEAHHSLKNKSIGILSRIMTALALTLLPLVYFYPAVMGKVLLAPGDGWSQNLPIRILIAEMIRNGHLPLWNPYIFCGMPLLASIQPGALYPATWLFAVFSPKTAMNLVVITTYHIALIGAYLYARRIGCNRFGSMIAGITFAFGGFMTAHLGHTNLIASGAWLPWILLALEELYLNLRWRWVALGALFIALLFFAGGPQVTFYALMVAGAYGLFSLRFREEKERRRRFLFGAAAMAACGALMAAIQVLPTRELTRQGERAALSYDYFASYSLAPRQLFEMIFPRFFGGGGLSPYKIPYWGTLGTTETASYVGMLAMIFGLIALIGHYKRKNSNRLVWFWGGCAVMAVFLAFGSYMPLGIHRLLYQAPIYNLFRASSRHVFEFDFACGALAGLGVTWVSRNSGEFVRRAVRSGVGVMALIVLVTATAYLLFADYLAIDTPLPAGAKSSSNPEFLIPVAFFVLSGAAVYFYTLCVERSAILKNVAGTAMIALFFADIASFGFFCEWRSVQSNIIERLADTPTVKLIKEREPDFNSFRVLSNSLPMQGPNSDLLDAPNISIVRGLQSASGYDPVYLMRYRDLAGDMTSAGEFVRISAFGSDDQAFNLLNVKYLLIEQPDIERGAPSIERDGVRFLDMPINFKLEPGGLVEARVNTTATELAIISAMGNSLQVPNGAPIVTISLYTKDGRVIERQLRAGEHTSEWAYDRPDVRALVKHSRAPVAESFPAGGFQWRQYIAHIPFERSEIERVAFKYEREDADVTFYRASFHDAETGRSTPMVGVGLAADRWRKIAQFKEVELYENTKALPRAWFARRAVIEPGDDALKIIRTGRMKDGSRFDPTETVLLERESFGGRKPPPQIGIPENAEAKTTRYEPQRIELQTRNSQPGFLVLSEIYYNGWEAWIDGRQAPVERVNYLLRGLSVPPGDHRIEFVYRAYSFRNGAFLFLFGVLLLFVGANNRVRGKVESWLDGPVTRTLTLAWANSKRLAPLILTAVESKLSALSKSRLIMIVAVIGLLIYGYILVKSAVYAVGWSDSSGYIRIARSILRGDLVQHVTELDQLGLSGDFIRCFIPPGYDPGTQPGTMTPGYSVGLPLLMAIGALIGGWEYGPFLINPIAAVLSIALIYLIGLELGLQRGFSIGAAIMLAVSPTFIYLTLLPMSDASTMFWGLAAVFGALRSRKRDGWAMLAGASFGMACLTRLTGVLLILPLIFALRFKPRTIIFFLLGGLPAAAIFFTYNAITRGNPMLTGYWATGDQGFLMKNGFIERFDYYRYWIKVTMSPLPILCWIAVIVDRKVEWRNRLMLFSWFCAFFIFYSFYSIPDYSISDAWSYTRFLLPGYPALVLGVALIARDLPELLRKWVSESNRARLKWAVLIVMMAIALSHERRYIRKLDVFSISRSEQRYPASSRWADNQLPGNSLIVSKQTSGALKFYTSRPIVRWDFITPENWPEVKKQAAEKGYQWYALLGPLEIEEAQKRISGRWTNIGSQDQFSLWRIEPAAD